VRILGPVEVVGGPRPVTIAGSRLRTLVVRLALSAGRVVAAESLYGALWPEALPVDPAHALQALVSRLRGATSEPSIVDSAPGGYRLNVAVDDVDALMFERLAREGASALRSGDAALAHDLLGRALGLWRSDSPPALSDEPFADASARLGELRLGAVEERAAAEIALGLVTSERVAELEGIAAAHPLRERLRATLMMALHGLGRDAEALTGYEEFRRLLAAELGADPGPELRETHLVVLGAAPGSSATEPPAARRRMKVALSGFVGREEECERAAGLMSSARLVTLTGPGGVGKTRLASEMAERRGSQFPGGVWFVELAAVADASLVLSAVSGSVGVRMAGAPGMASASGNPLDRLVEALSAPGVLLILDNCEHVLDAVAGLAEELLGRCGDLTVLVTSRECLGIPGEMRLPVPPLGLPPEGGGQDHIRTAAAVRLFADRAAAVQPGFAISDDNGADVAEICRRLDGLPLAIELAAARLGGLPLRQLRMGLRDRFALLARGSRTAPARHRALAAVVAWSWSLLSDEERAFAECVAVFRGRITPEAADRVAGTAGKARDLLAALTDKSLLRLEAGSDASFRMLETIGEYGREMLAAAGRLEEVLDRYTGYFLDLAETAEPSLRRSDQLSALRTLGAERANLDAAYQLCLDEGDGARAVRFAAALGLFWMANGDHADAAARIHRGLEAPGPSDARARAVAAGGYLLNLVLSGGYLPGGDAAGWPTTNTGHPLVALIEPARGLLVDDTDAGLAAVRQAMAVDDAWTRGMLNLMAAMLHGNRGDLDAVHEATTAALSGFTESGDRWGQTFALMIRSELLSTRGRFPEAIVALETSIRLTRELDPDNPAVLQRAFLAEIRFRAGETGAALAELLVLAETAGASPRDLTSVHLILGHLARGQGDVARADRHYAEARLALERVQGFPQLHAMLAAARVHLRLNQDDLEGGWDRAAEAFDAAIRVPDMPIVALVGVAVARLVRVSGSAKQAAAVLGAASVLRGAPDAFNPDSITTKAELIAELGERAFSAAYRSGAGLGRAEALALIETHSRRR
jgi:predicted ATPase